MILFYVSMLVIAGAVFAQIVLAQRSEQRRATARKEMLGPLEATGLQLVGDPIGAYDLQGNYGGIDLRFENQVSAQPPWTSDSENSEFGARIKFWAPVPHSLVCPRSATKEVVVQFPPTAKTATGHREFDSAYDVFIDWQKRSAQSPAGTFPWPPPNVLESLVDLELKWLRVKDDAAELVIERIQNPSDVPRVLMTAQALALAARGQTSNVRIRRGRLAERPVKTSNAASTMLAIALGVALLLIAPISSITLCFLPFVSAAIETDVCGAGQRLLVSVQQDTDGTGYGMYCSGNPDASLIWLHLICGSLGAALVLAPATFIAISKDREESSPQR